MKDAAFTNQMNETEKNVWNSFTALVKNFLGNFQFTKYEELVNSLLKAYKSLGCNMSVKEHFFQSHLDYFSENLEKFSQGQGERFHQDLKAMEKRYKGKWNTSMIADYCWCLKRGCQRVAHSQQSKKRKFTPQ